MNDDLGGKTIIITGGSSGIGAAAGRELRRRGATVAITGRSATTAAFAREIGAEPFLADYAKLRDVRALAGQLLERYPRIDILANNVGGVIDRRQITEDGHEKTFQVNHLAGFLLTGLLRERLEASGGSVINTASAAHRWGHLDLDDLENARAYSPWTAYGTAKLMNILHAAELNRRFDGVRGVSFHPGVVATGFAREGGLGTKLLYGVGKLFMISSEKGADTLIWLASSKPGVDWTPGEFYEKRRPAGRTPQAADQELARRLWDSSDAML